MPLSISRRRRPFSARSPSRLAAHRLLDEDEGRFRRLLIEKPFGHDLASARALNQMPAEAGGRAANLPDRSLSRQGNGPQHHGGALRQPDDRSGVEQPLCRPCPDHRRRSRRRRPAGQILRCDRRASRHGAQPFVPAARDGRHGAAQQLRRQRDPGRKDQGRRGDPQALAGRGEERRRARPLWRRTRRQGAASRLFGRTRRRSEQPHRDLCGDEIVPRHLALVGRPFLPADRQGDGAAGHGDRAPVQAGSLRLVPPCRRDQPPAQPPGHPYPARRGDQLRFPREIARAGHRDRAGQHGLSLRAIISSSAGSPATRPCSTT